MSGLHAELIPLANHVLVRCIRCQSYLPEHPESLGGTDCESCEYQYAKELALKVFNLKY